jgi:hypothetical protein
MAKQPKVKERGKRRMGGAGRRRIVCCCRQSYNTANFGRMRPVARDADFDPG